MPIVTGFVVQADGLPHIDKDPDASLTYTWDWNAWLAQRQQTGIASAQILADAGVTLVGVAFLSFGYVTQLVEGGTVFNSYKLVCRIISLPDQLVDDRTIVLDIKER